MGKIVVHRKGYKRRAYVRKDGVRVKSTVVPPTTYEMVDRGAKGRGRKVIPSLKKGTLGVDFSKPASVRRAKEKDLARRIGEKKVVGKLLALAVLNKRTDPSLARKARADAHFIAGSFVGKREVPYPQGFRRKLK